MNANGTATATPIPESAPVTGTLTELVSGIIGDAQTLIKQQVTMLRSEIKEDMRRSKEAARFYGLAALLATLGTVSIVFTAVYALNYFTELSMVASWAIVTALLFVGGISAFLVGRHLFSKFNPLPDKTFNALSENLTWTTKPRN